MRPDKRPASDEQIAAMRCVICRQRSMKRAPRPFEYDVKHDGRLYKVRIPDLSAIVCTNSACPGEESEKILNDDAGTWRITVETYRQLGLLTPGDIRAGRKKLGMSQQEFQELLGLGGNTLSRWESGRVYQSRAMDRFLRVVFSSPEARKVLASKRMVEGFDKLRLRVGGEMPGREELHDRKRKELSK